MLTVPLDDDIGDLEVSEDAKDVGRGIANSPGVTAPPIFNRMVVLNVANLLCPL